MPVHRAIARQLGAIAAAQTMLRWLGLIRSPAAPVINLSDDDRPVLGQRVAVKDQDVCLLFPCGGGRAWEVIDSVGYGYDGFVKLKDVKTGELHPTWHRSTELEPARTVRDPKELPLYGIRTTEERQMAMNIAAERFEKRVNQLAASGKPWDEAISLAEREDEQGADAYRLAKLSGYTPPEIEPVMFTLSAGLEAKAANGASFDQLVQDYANEVGCDLRRATHVIGVRFPKLTEAR